ncbi:hypothetical protein LPW11_05165 [Geomonas sp. RF6]|uniref:hypothetical protein n=1 Tax=Geomonas sp. RF6 TaxID=2897342 RepID=UPI001E28B10A|nr:hypothetical protein [Geomonas sp. RF6]UFS71588.1 hypothetical protein LPW11_05165 [Geomonas sp. RF6]
MPINEIHDLRKSVQDLAKQVEVLQGQNAALLTLLAAQSFSPLPSSEALQETAQKLTGNATANLTAMRTIKLFGEVPSLFPK